MNNTKRILLFTMAGLGFRILHYLLFANKIVANSDSMQNILLARNFASGDFYAAMDTYWSPIFAIFVGIVSYFIDDLVLPTIIVSILMGSLAVPITYILADQSYGRRVATIGAVIAIFYPFLIRSVFILGTETFYLVWIIGALIVGWIGLQRESKIHFFVTGLLLGLGYLTRPEAFGYPIFFVLFLLLKKLFQKKLTWRSLSIQIATLVLGFAILSTPYILYLRSETGEWTISDKFAANIALGDQEEGLGDEAPPPSFDTKTGSAMVVTYFYGVKEVQKVIAILVPFLLLMLIALGLFREKWDKERLEREFYLMFFCFLTILGYVLTVPIARYFYVLLPIVFVWIARGIIEFEGWYRDSAKNWIPMKSRIVLSSRAFVILSLIFVYLYSFPSNFYVRSAKTTWQSSAFEERDAGVWLKKHGKKSPTVFSASFRPVFYAEGKQVWLETDDVENIFEQLKARKVNYVVSNERMVKKYPYLKELTDLLEKDPDFKLIYERNDQPGYKIAVFKLLD